MTDTDALAIADQVRRRDRSPAEVVSDAIRRIECLDPALNAVIHPRFEKAVAEAKVWPSGPLAGAPNLLEDASITQAGEPWHESLQAARNARHIATTTSFLTQRLIDAGCVILGRTNIPELCTHVTTEPSAYGPTRNSWSPEFSAGGSSGGSGASIAAGMVAIAHGSDGGGSVRVAAAVLNAVAGAHPSDPCQTPLFELISPILDSPLPRLRIGLRTRGACGCDRAHPVVDALTRGAARWFEAVGDVVEEASPRALDEEDGVARQGIVVAACLASELAAWSRRLGREIALEELELRNRMSVVGGRKLTGQ